MNKTVLKKKYEFVKTKYSIELMNFFKDLLNFKQDKRPDFLTLSSRFQLEKAEEIRKEDLKVVEDDEPESMPESKPDQVVIESFSKGQQ